MLDAIEAKRPRRSHECQGGCGRAIAVPIFLGNESSRKRIPICEKCCKDPKRRERALEPFSELMEARREIWSGLSAAERRRRARRERKQG